MSTTWKYEIIGKIIPERVDFSCSLPLFRITESNFGYDFEMALSIQKSQISTKITSNSQITDFETLRNIVRDFIRLHTDTYGYLHGYAYDVEIISLTGDNNIPHTIYGVQINELEIDFVNRPIQNFEEICKLMYGGNNNELKIALNDLRLSIQYPDDTGMFCYRAVESLMQYFNHNDKDKAWEQFRNTLNISRSFIKPLEDKSWPSRHGKQIPITHFERVEAMKRSWKIVDRFIIYVKNENRSLDKSTYPEL